MVYKSTPFCAKDTLQVSINNNRIKKVYLQVQLKLKPLLALERHLVIRLVILEPTISSKEVLISEIEY